MSDRPAARTTVVIPVWDAYVAHRLDQAVRSLRDQDLPVSVVVVDNASQVALPPLPGVSVVQSSTRLTVGAARNLGLSHVTTPNVIFWDADDVMLPGTLAALEEAIAGDSRLVAFGRAILEDPGGGRYRWPRRWIKPLVRRPTLFGFLNCVWSMYPATGATIMRSDAVHAAGGYPDEEIGDDWCLGISLAFRGRLGWSECPGRLYRVHDESISHRYGGLRDTLRRTQAVRARIRSDSAIPGWVRSVLPGVALAQFAAVMGHEVTAAARRMRSDNDS